MTYFEKPAPLKRSASLGSWIMTEEVTYGHAWWQD